MVLQALPKLAAEISAPLAQCEKITMVSTGDGEIGVSQLTGELLHFMTRLPQVVQSMTGVDLLKSAQAV
ncbi:Flotillin-1 [Fasciola hepatica]|uniref:Flotillin-1 n=1 Tax=Fasciola hepatica TaxID=6192 RepID=A0A4E0RGR1_FASHE|nr:Flotillin-1 [Fasciola hepatica]